MLDLPFPFAYRSQSVEVVLHIGIAGPLESQIVLGHKWQSSMYLNLVLWSKVTTGAFASLQFRSPEDMSSVATSTNYKAWNHHFKDCHNCQSRAALWHRTVCDSCSQVYCWKPKTGLEVPLLSLRLLSWFQRIHSRSESSDKLQSLWPCQVLINLRLRWWIAACRGVLGLLLVSSVVCSLVKATS